MRATVHVFLKPGVLDVQGKAVESALHGLGWDDVNHVRVGRTIEFDIDGPDKPAAEAKVRDMCERLIRHQFCTRSCLGIGRFGLAGGLPRELEGESCGMMAL